VSRALLSICLLVLATAHAVADPAGEQLFRDGRTLLKAGKIDEACEKFQQSRDVEVKFGTVLNLADCREKQGKFATAWELFLEAKGLATTQKGATEIALAERRAKLIAGKRAFLTISIPADHRVPGLVITRNGIEVAASTWDQPLAIDPGNYVIEAKASGYESATVTAPVAAKAKVTATVPALVKIPVVEPPPKDNVIAIIPPGPVGPEPGEVRKGDVPPVAPAGVTPPVRRGALGVALGGTSDGDLTPGLRAIAATEAGPGALRGVFNFQYARLPNDPSYSADNSNLFAFGIGVEYLLAWRAGLGSAAGIGVGLDLFTGGFDDEGKDADPSYGLWKAVRVSPIIARLRSRPVELGLHAVIIVQDSPILIGTAAVDWFFW
jgi:hypothetical protein